MHLRSLIATLVAAISLLQACASPSAIAQIRLGDPALKEASGLAASALDRSLLWLINDGGHPATLHAVDNNGAARAHLKIRGKKNRDWEDMTSLSWRDKHWLVVADIGDNNADNKKSTLHFIEEPALKRSFKKFKRKAKYSIDFRYPDGPRDAEAIAFDPLSEQILILSKRDRPAQLYALPLAALLQNPRKNHTAQALGALPWAGDAPTMIKLLRDPKRAISHGMATAFDISDDGLRAVILGYQQAVLLRRSADQAWSQAQITPLPPHGLEQAEALAISADGASVYITSEGANAPLIQQRLP